MRYQNSSDIEKYWADFFKKCRIDTCLEMAQEEQNERDGIFECFLPEVLEFVVQGKKITNCESCPYFEGGTSFDPMFCRLIAKTADDVYDAHIITNPIYKTGFPVKCPLREKNIA